MPSGRKENDMLTFTEIVLLAVVVGPWLFWIYVDKSGTLDDLDEEK